MTNLTDISLIEYLLSNPQPGGERIPVHIRTKEKCPVCSKPFQHIQRIGFVCPVHKTQPSRYFVDVYYQKQFKIYSHKNGRVLDSYQLAIETLDVIKHEIRTHSFDPSKWVAGDIKKFLFENIIEKWIELKEKEGIATIHKHKQFNRDYYSHFTGQDVRDIRTGHIHEFYSQLKTTISNKTKKNILAALHAFFNWLLTMEYIEKMPGFPKIENKQHNWQWLDEQTQADILLAIPTEDRHIFSFLALHGCRISEARALKIKDIDFRHKSIAIRRTYTGKACNEIKETTKTNKTRVIPINPYFEETVKQLCHNRFGEDFVFVNPRTKKPYAMPTIQEIWQKARKTAGINITAYEGLRHSFASQRICQGADLYLISKILGHTDIRTTQIYAHTNLESLRKVININHTPLPQAETK
jgi:integrase